MVTKVTNEMRFHHVQTKRTWIKALIGICFIFSIIFINTNAGADSRIWFVDGIGDIDNKVTGLFGNYNIYPFGYLDEGTFYQIAGIDNTNVWTFDGGEIVNFAIKVEDSYLDLLHDQASLTWMSPEIDKDNAQVPPAPFYHSYYRGVTMDWVTGGISLTMYITSGDPTDGAYVIPLPTTTLLLGTGFLAFVLLRKKVSST
jgi:hypothetical protein